MKIDIRRLKNKLFAWKSIYLWIFLFLSQIQLFGTKLTFCSKFIFLDWKLNTLVESGTSLIKIDFFVWKFIILVEFVFVLLKIICFSKWKLNYFIFRLIFIFPIGNVCFFLFHRFVCIKIHPYILKIRFLSKLNFLSKNVNDPFLVQNSFIF